MTSVQSGVKEAVRKVTQDMDDVADVWRHCRIAMVNSADTDEVVGFPSFTKADLRTLLAALSSQASVMEAMAKGLSEAGDAFEAIRITMVNHLNEPERTAFWAAVSGRNNARTALSQYRSLNGDA